MMAKHFHTTIKPNGRRYYYFRPPSNLQWRYGKSLIRLSDDLETALRESDELFNGAKVVDDRPPTKQERSAARRMLNNATGRAGKRRMAVDLDIPSIIDMMRAQQFRCCITLLPFDLNWRVGRSAKRNAYAPSLDRRDNAKGYTKENCRIVLAAVNYAMNEWGLETYLEVAKAAVWYGGREQKVDEVDKPSFEITQTSPVCDRLKPMQPIEKAWWAHQGSNLGPDD